MRASQSSRRCSSAAPIRNRLANCGLRASKEHCASGGARSRGVDWVETFDGSMNKKQTSSEAQPLVGQEWKCGCSIERCIVDSVDRARLPEYSALSVHTDIYVTSPSNWLLNQIQIQKVTDPVHMIDALGAAMLVYRSWGRNGTILLSDKGSKIESAQR